MSTRGRPKKDKPRKCKKYTDPLLNSAFFYYITSDVVLADVEAEYGISIGTLKNYSSKDRWHDIKNAIGFVLGDGKMLDSGASPDEKMLDILDKLYSRAAVDILAKRTYSAETFVKAYRAWKELSDTKVDEKKMGDFADLLANIKNREPASKPDGEPK